MLAAQLATGAVSGLITGAIALSFAALVFSGDLLPHLAVGSGLYLVGTALMNLVTARWSSLAGGIMVPQDATSAIVAVTLATILQGVDADQRLGTAIVFAVLCAVATGAVMLVLGLSRSGHLVRFVPHPVIGGFMAGTGVLLIYGAADLATSGFRWDTSSVIALAGAASLAVGFLVWTRFRPSVTALPVMVISGVAIFYMVLALTGTGLEEARALGLLPDLTSTRFQFPIGELGLVDWSAIAAGAGGVITVAVVATLGLLLNVTGLEVVADQDADLDRELRAVGTANLLGSVTGTAPGYYTIGITAISYRAGLGSRLVPVMVAGVCLSGLAVSGVVTALPTPLVATILLMIGLSFLDDWLVRQRKAMTWPEYLMMVAIVVAVATLGLLPAVLLGTLAAAALFVVAYSRANPIRHVSTARERRSAVYRDAEERRVLLERGEAALIVELQGYLFFGTARTLVDRISALLPDDGQMDCLVIDMARVQGADSTALTCIARLARVAARHGFRMIVSDVDGHLATQLLEAVPVSEQVMVLAPDLEDALELAEEILLSSVDDPTPPTLESTFGPQLWPKLSEFLEATVYPEGAVVVDTGDESVGLFLIASGRVVAELPTGDGRWTRVGSFGAGSVLGEMSLYLSRGRTARLVAEAESVVYLLGDDAVARLEREDPVAAASLHRFFAALLAERLALSNDTVSALLR